MKTNPCHGTSLSGLTRLLEMQERYSEVEEIYRNAVRTYPLFVENYFHLVEALHVQKKYLEAEDAIKEALEYFPEDKTFMYTYASVLLDKGDIEALEKLIRDELAKGPGNIDLIMDLAVRVRFDYFGYVVPDYRAHYDKSEKILRLGLNIFPDNDVIMKELGPILHAQMKYSDAEELYRRALNLNPSDVSSIVGLSRALREQERYREAEELINRSLREESPESSLYYELGMIFRSQGKHADAETALRSGLYATPDNAPLLSQLADLLKLQNKMVEAVAVYRQGFEKYPKSYQFFEPLVLLLLELDKGEEIEDICRNVADNRTFRFEFENMNRIFRNQREFQKSERLMRIGLRIIKNDVTFLNELGWSLFYQYKNSEAENCFKEVLRIAPDNRTGFNGLGMINIRRKEYDKAERYYQKYLEVSPNPNPAHGEMRLGTIDLLRQDYAAAEAHLTKAKTIRDADVRIDELLGYTYAGVGRFTEAEICARTALSNMDSTLAGVGFSFFKCYNLLAWILIAGEMDIDRGMEFAQKALANKPDDFSREAKIYPYIAAPEFTLGLGFIKQGNSQKAVEFLTTAVELYPERDAIKEALKAVKR